MKIKTLPLALLTLAVLFGTILVTNALGWWHTESTKEPARYAEGEAAGEYNPADLRGSYDFATISEQFDIPTDVLLSAFGFPEGTDPAEAKLKDLELLWADVSTEALEVGTGSVRLFVAALKGLPLDLEEGTGLPAAAADIVMTQGAPTEEQKAFILTHQVGDAGAANSPAGSVPAEAAADGEAATGENTAAISAADAPVSAEETEHTESERKVSGAVTWKDIESWGVSREAMEEVFGREIPSMTSLVKDSCSQAGMEFSSIKAALQTLVDQAE